MSAIWIKRSERLLWQLLSTPPSALLLIDAQRGSSDHCAYYWLRLLLCEMPKNENPCDNCRSCRLLASADNCLAHPDAICHRQALNVNEVRALIEQSTTTPMVAKKRVIYLAEIENYHESAVNALLKTLEETNNYTYFVLTTNNVRAVRATIVSRCQQLNLAQASYDEALAWLVGEHNFSRQSAVSLLAQDKNPYQALQQQNILQADQSIDSLIAFLLKPKKALQYLSILQKIDKTQQLQYLNAQIIALIYARQLDEFDDNWQNLQRHKKQIAAINVLHLHKINAKLAALRRVENKQLNQFLNIEALLFQTLDKRDNTL